MKTTIVLDLSVALHQLDSVFTQSQIEKEHWLGVLKAQLVWLQSGKWLGELLDNPEDTQLIAVCDSKPYWRTDYLKDPTVYTKVPEIKRGKAYPRVEPIHYKGGRKFPSYNFTKVKEKTYKLFDEQGWSRLGITNYEADDVAAGIVMSNRMLPHDQQHRIILVTTDADWMGLIDHNTYWFCMHGWQPRLRHDMEVINTWAKKRLKKDLENPRDIWRVKSAQGDKSDNLPPGSPIEVIDLTEPPLEHRLWLNPGMSGVIKQILKNPESLRVQDTDRAEDYLRRLGIPKCIRTYNPSDLKQPMFEVAA